MGRGVSCEDTYEPVSARRDDSVRGFKIGALGCGASCVNVVTGEVFDRVRAHGGASGALVVPGRGYPCEVTGAADRLRGVGGFRAGGGGAPVGAAPDMLPGRWVGQGACCENVAVRAALS